MKSKEGKLLFWKLQISGWFLLLIVYLLLFFRNYLDDIRTISGLTLTYITGFLITLALRQFYKHVGYRNRSIFSISLLIIGGTIVSANIWFWFDASISQIIFGDLQTLKEFDFSKYVNLIWSKSFIIILWSAIYFSIKLWNEWLEERNRAEKADSLAHKAQLQMLRYQLNPHFLFNSLNSIRALIEEDKIRAKSMITELSEFLRYSLISKNLSYVPLSSELDATKHYFAIEKTRFEEKLEVTFSVDPLTEDIQVPSFLIHPLIENAIKYGMKTSRLPLLISIKSTIASNHFCLEVCNSGKWMEKSNHNESTGTGLNNVRQRLLNAYPDNHKFSISKSSDIVCVKIEILNISKS
jgi:two-component system, LytTR family, sensor kinase